MVLIKEIFAINFPQSAAPLPPKKKTSLWSPNHNHHTPFGKLKEVIEDIPSDQLVKKFLGEPFSPNKAVLFGNLPLVILTHTVEAAKLLLICSRENV